MSTSDLDGGYSRKARALKWIFTCLFIPYLNYIYQLFWYETPMESEIMKQTFCAHSGVLEIYIVTIRFIGGGYQSIQTKQQSHEKFHH
jgi:hypothetical protein